MFDTPRFTQSNITVVFEDKEDIKTLSHVFQTYLGERFHPAQTTPVPDEAPPEIPRFFMFSKNGFSMITISKINLIMTVTYSPDWQLNIELGKQYILDRIPIIFNLLSHSNISPLYMGFKTTAMLKASKEEYRNVLKKFSDIYLKTFSNQTDLQIKYSKIIDEKYFSNIESQTYKKWYSVSGYTNKISLSNFNEYGIQVTHDFNNRYSFNENIPFQLVPEYINDLINYNINLLNSEISLFQ